MQSRIVNLILLGLNLGLIGVVIFLVGLVQKERQQNTRVVFAPRTTTNTVTQIAVRKINATNLLALLASRQMSWAHLESTNYFVYVANLRAFGVPEETLRDIVVADVHKLYAQRRAAIRAQAPQPAYWQTASAWRASHSLPPELQAQLEALNQEERELLRQLLGIDPERELARFAEEPQADWAWRLSFLPAEKQDAVAELLRRYERLEQEVHRRAHGLLLDEDQRELRQLARAKEAELAQILSPEELEQYQLRYSPVADKVRHLLEGFNPTEEEFRTVFRLCKTLEEQLGDESASTDGKQAEARTQALQQAKAALEEEIRQALGPSRYAEYQRAQDEDYRALLQLAARFDLDPQIAGRVYDMKRAAQQQKQAVLTDPNLTDEQRRAALQAVAAETKRSVAELVGERVWNAYGKLAGQWIQDLAKAPELEPREVQIQTVPVPVPVFPPGIPPPPPGPFDVPPGLAPTQR